MEKYTKIVLILVCILFVILCYLQSLSKSDVELSARCFVFKHKTSIVKSQRFLFPPKLKSASGKANNNTQQAREVHAAESLSIHNMSNTHLNQS